MNMTQTYSRTTLNGVKWEIVADNFGAALYMNGNYSGYYFRSVEEANAHLNAIDERLSAPTVFNAPLDCSSFYGRGASVYYGD